MHVDDRGPRDARVVLLIHGQVAAGAIYGPLAERLARSRRVLVPDLPGYGTSSPLSPAFTLEGVRDALAQELKTRGVSGADLVGVSLGTYHAVALALHEPALVSSLALLGPVVGLDPADKATFGGFADLMAGTQPMSTWDDLLVHRWFADHFVREHPDIVARVLDLWHAAPRETLRQEFVAMVAMSDLRLRLGELRVPTLVRAGREDRTFPLAMAEAIASAISGARLEVVEGASHQLLYEDAEATIASVCAHLGA